MSSVMCKHASDAASIKDKNGAEIRKGSIVKIEGWNDIYFVSEVDCKNNSASLENAYGDNKGKSDGHKLEVLNERKRKDGGVEKSMKSKSTTSRTITDKYKKIIHVDDIVIVDGKDYLFKVIGFSDNDELIARCLKDNVNMVIDPSKVEVDNSSKYNGVIHGKSMTDLIVEKMKMERRNKSGKDGSGKDDRADGKPRWELLPLETVEEIVKVYTMGAEKYADEAWKNIPDGYRRYKAALLRHITAYDKGERVDKESGLSHLAHAAWNAIAMLYYDISGKGGENV